MIQLRSRENLTNLTGGAAPDVRYQTDIAIFVAI